MEVRIIERSLSSLIYSSVSVEGLLVESVAGNWKCQLFPVEFLVDIDYLIYVP